MQRLSGLIRRYLRQRWGRTALTGLGICLGVAVLFTTLIVIASIDRGLDRMRVASDGMDVVGSPVGGAGSMVPDDVVDELARSESVDAVLRALSYRADLAVADDPDTVNSFDTMRVFGVDLAEVERFYPMDPAEGRLFEPDTDEVVLSRRNADRLNVGPGDRVLVTLPQGRVPLLVTGLLDDRGLALRNDGQLLFTSLATARRLIDQPDALSFVALRLDEGIDVRSWLATNADVEPRLQLVGPDESASPLRAALGSIGAAFTVYAALVLLVAVFLVFLTLSMAIAERQATLGILRALGADRADLFRLVLIEALVLGVVATAAGLAVGIALAVVFLDTGVAGSDALRFPDAGLLVTGRAVVAASALGIGATLLGAYLPARRAARLAPLDAIREPIGRATADASRSRRSGLAGLAVLGAGLTLAPHVEDSALRTGAVLFLLLGGAVLIVPAVLPWLARRLAVVGAWRAARMARVAVPHLVRERARAAYTLGLAMAVLAMVTAMGAVITSVEHTGDRQFAAQFSAGLDVRSGLEMSNEFMAKLATVPGIAGVATARWGRTEIRLGDDAQGTFAQVMAIEPTTWFDVSSFAWTAGSDAAVAQRLARGGAVVVPEYVARQVGAGIGGTVVLDTRTGWRRFEIAGIYATVGSTRSGDMTAAIVMSQADGAEALGLTRTTQVVVDVADGARLDAVTRAVDDLHDGSTTFWTQTADDWHGFYQDELDGFRAIMRSIIFPAALVSALGLANTLAVAMLERRREIGVLRAVGLGRPQTRALAIVEASLQVGIAALLALPLGYALSRPAVAAAATTVGTVFDYAYPWRWLVWVAVLAFALALGASIGPAVRAARTNISAALRFE